jgi:O-methyltransferase domain/Dimerisation domain
VRGRKGERKLLVAWGHFMLSAFAVGSAPHRALFTAVWDFADSGIAAEDKFAGAGSALLEIGSVRGEELPAGEFFSENTDGPHVGELALQACVVFVCGCEPHAVVLRSLVAFVAQDADNFLSDVNGEASEHRIRSRRDLRERVEHEFVRDRFLLLDGERIPFRHRPHDTMCASMFTQAAAPKELPPQVTLANMTIGFWISQAISVAAQLEIADRLASGPLTANQLAHVAGAHAPSLYRVLRALASVGIFEEDTEARFHLTPMAECLRAGVPGSMRAWVLMMGDPAASHVWSDLLHSVRTGETSFDHFHGMRFFDYGAKHPDFSRQFDEAMTSMSAPEIAGVIESYDFSGFGTLIDVAGGHGSLMEAILKKTPGLKGVVADQPSVIEGTRKLIAESGLADRCTTAEMNFFESVPAGGDAYMMKHIIHDWEDELALKILRNCHRAMGPNAKLLLVEAVIQPGNHPGFDKWLDVAMLAYAGGCERTESGYRDLLAQAGFRLTRIVPTASPVSVVEAVPA